MIDSQSYKNNYKLFVIEEKLNIGKRQIIKLLEHRDAKLYEVDIVRQLDSGLLYYFLTQTTLYVCEVRKNQTPYQALFANAPFYSDNQRRKKFYNLSRLDKDLGIFYPRIYRPYFQLDEKRGLNLESSKVLELEKIVLDLPVSYPYQKDLVISSINKLSLLTDYLKDIFNNVHPVNSNLNSYGNAIKNLLVLSCVEVEAQLKGILKEHEHSPKKSYSTKDYIKLKDLLKLNKYSVKFPLYPDLKSFSPFRYWNDRKGASKSISWYNDYNYVKHDSFDSFNRAKLISVINSICAIVILLRAQYGPHLPYWNEKIGSFYHVTNKINWKMKETILPPFIDGKWIPQRLKV